MYDNLNEQFSGSSLDTNKWQYRSDTSSSDVTVSSGSLKIATTYNAYRGISPLGISTDGTVQLPEKPDSTVVFESKIDLIPQRAGTQQYAIGFDMSMAGYLAGFQCYTSTGTGAGTTYNIVSEFNSTPTGYLYSSLTSVVAGGSIWLRISLSSAGVVKWEHSTNGTTWTVSTIPAGAIDFPNTRVTARLEAFHVVATGASVQFGVDYFTLKTSEAPKISFGSAQSTSNPLQFTFTDTSPGTKTAWLWNFGDGSTSTAQNPTYTYAAPGSYTVSLQATSAVGTNSTSRSIALAPSSTPIVGFGGGWGGFGGYGRTYGELLTPITIITSRIQLANARIQITTARTITANARLTRIESRTQPSNARITATTLRTIASNARIQKTVDRTILANARVQALSSRNQSVNARIDSAIAATTQNQPVNASILVVQARTILANARITNVVLRTITANARLQKTEIRNLLANGRIQRTELKTQLANAAIRRTTDKTISAAAVIQYIQVKTILANARISKSSSYVQLANGRIRVSVLRTIQANGRILLIPTQNQPARALIAKEYLQTMPASAFIIRISDDSKPRLTIRNPIMKVGVRNESSRSAIRPTRNGAGVIQERPRVSIIRNRRYSQ